MGFLAPAQQAPEVLVVATAMGKANIRPDAESPATGAWAKARLFVLEDRTAVLVTPGPGPREVTRTSYLVAGSDWASASQTLTVVTDDGSIITMDARGCGCNMGMVGSAGPVDGAYRLSKVRAPEWHTVNG